MEVRIIFGLLKLKNISNIREEILLYFLFAVKVFIKNNIKFCTLFIIFEI